MKQLLSFLLLFTISIPVFSQIYSREKTCVNAKNLAQKDVYNNELKYYKFGLMAFDRTSDIQNQLLKKQYNIQVIQLGCVVSDSILCYNEMAEKILFSKYGKGFWDIVQKQVDSTRMELQSFGDRIE